MKRIIAAGIASVAFLISACSGGSYGTVGPANTSYLTSGTPGGSTTPYAPTSNTALFHYPAPFPYPIDFYFAGSATGTLNIPLSGSLYPSVTSALNNLDGYSTTGVIRAYFGGALNPATLAAGTIVLQVKIDNATKATVGFVRPLIQGTDYSVALATDAGVGNTIVEITPLHPLVPSTAGTNNGYLVILTNAIQDTLGNHAIPDSDYATILGALQEPSPCSSIPATSPLNGICLLTGAQLQVAAAVLPGLGINPANIVQTFSFSTQSIADVMGVVEQLAAAQSIHVNCPPQLVQASPLHAADLCVGVTTVPYYLSRAAPLTQSWQGQGASALTRFNPKPIATQNIQIPVLVSVPHGVAAPASGWPVAMVVHGLTRSREDALAMSDSFASAGFVVVAIDMPLHGITNQMDPFYASGGNPLYGGLGLPAPTAAEPSIERTFDLDLGTNNAAGNGVIYGSPPDGKIDPSGSWFLNLTAPLVGRDNFREGPADLITLAHSLEANGITVVAPAGSIKVDPARVHYVGLSLGAVMGTVYLGSTPNLADAQTASLAAPGGGYARYLTESASFSAAFLPILEAQGLIPGTSLFANYTRDLQNITDSSDPWNFIAAAVAYHPTHIMQMVGGGIQNGTATLPDQVIPNVGTQRLISAAPYGGMNGTLGGPGLPELNTLGNNISANGWRAYTNFICGAHGSLFDPSINAKTTGEMQAQAVTFAAGSAAGNVIVLGSQAPTVIGPQPAGTACP